MHDESEGEREGWSWEQKPVGRGGMLHFAKESLATLGTDVTCPLDDHNILLAVGLVLKVVVHIRQRHLTLHTAEASRVESPALISDSNRHKKRMGLVIGAT